MVVVVVVVVVVVSGGCQAGVRRVHAAGWGKPCWASVSAQAAPMTAAAEAAQLQRQDTLPTSGIHSPPLTHAPTRSRRACQAPPPTLTTSTYTHAHMHMHTSTATSVHTHTLTPRARTRMRGWVGLAAPADARRHTAKVHTHTAARANQTKPNHMTRHPTILPHTPFSGGVAVGRCTVRCAASCAVQRERCQVARTNQEGRTHTQPTCPSSEEVWDARALIITPTFPTYIIY